MPSLPGRTGPERTAALAVAILAAACIAAVAAARAPAQSAIEKLNAVQSKLEHNRSKQGVLTTTISHYSDRIAELRKQLAELRNREAVVGAELAQVQGQLDSEQTQLDTLRAQLKHELASLSQRLVDIYESNDPDILTVVLSAHGFQDLLERNDYMSRISDSESDIVARVRDLRNQTQEIVDKIKAQRDEVAAKKAELDRTRDEVIARNDEFAKARAEQRKVLGKVRDQKDELEGDLEKISKQISAQLGGGSPIAAGPIRNGGHGLIWPVNGPITSPFGGRNIGNGYEFHPGVDIGVGTGTPIRAAADGTVTIAGPEGGYGNYTCIDHGGGLSTCYGHQQRFAVVGGQHVSQGQVIGFSDCTGYCFGPHVHFEVRINGQVTDPLNYF